MSEEKNKGISLRRKKTTRPSISAPRQISQTEESGLDNRKPSLARTHTNESGAGSLAVPGERPGRGDKTSDLVKRRYSTRFAGGVPQSEGGIPAIPGFPAQFANENGDSRSPSRNRRSTERGRLKVDVGALRDPTLQADKYVQSILGEATESDILAYQNSLQDVKQHASTDLQHNVYQNRTQFIKISKEADKLKTEMRTLRTLMSELTGALGHATSAGGADLTSNTSLSVADRKRANRSSVANLEALWSSHLQILWKRVEGSQKYLPALPGRHIITESQRWVELNAATWKPRRRVALVLLNDHLLIAIEKKRKDLIAADAKSKRQSTYDGGPSANQTTFVAERCWALQDVSLADISSGDSRGNGSISNAVNVRAGNESFTYATSDSAEKAGLIVAFRKAQEDLRKVMAVEHGHRLQDANDKVVLSSGRDSRSLKKAAAVGGESLDGSGTASAANKNNSVLVDADGRQQSVRWVESQIDTLDIDIALQRFDDAVGRVEQLRKLARSIRGNATATEIIQAKVNERASLLAAKISRQLIQTSAGMERTKENVSHLLRLGFEEMARLRYLDARTETIRLRTRSLPFTGSLPPYLHSLSYTTFTLLLHTFRTFAASFPPASGSAVVKWAKERVDEFNEIVMRQMGSLDKGSGVWKECEEIVRGQVEVLLEVGVDFRGLVMKEEPKGL